MVIGPGTGLGAAASIPDGTRWIPLATEAGHATLAAATGREAEIIEQLRTRFDHVSAERALSGPGLVNLYLAVAAITDNAPETLTPADVTSRALRGTDPLCAEAAGALSVLRVVSVRPHLERPEFIRPTH